MTVRVAQKFGLDVKDPNLELRLRKIEKELQSAGVAATTVNATQGSVSTDSSVLDLAPAPFNLAVTNPIETVTVTWDAVKPSDFVEYEIQVDDNVSFTSPEIFTTKEESFTYKEGAANTEYFFKVRQVTTNTGAGEFSGIISLGTGQIVTENIQDEASKIFASQTTTSSIDLSGSGTTLTGASVTVDNEFQKPVSIFGSYIVDTIVFPEIVTILLRRVDLDIFGVPVPTTISTVEIGRENVVGTGTGFGSRVQSSLLIGVDTAPPAGTSTYDLTFVNSATGSANIMSHSRIVVIEVLK